MRLIARQFQRLTLQLGILSGFGTLLMTIVIVADVAGRVFFNAPIPGGNEFSELLLIAMIFLGLAAAQQHRQHFAVELVTQHLTPAVKRWVDIGGWLVSLAVVGLLTWLSAKQAWLAMLRGEASYGTVSFPIWPARAILAFGLGLLSLQLAVDILRALCRPDAAPGRSKPVPHE